MKSRSAFAIALGVIVFAQSLSLLEPAHAARKYYPPGFTPPSDQKLVPSATPTPDPQPQVIIQQVPGSKQVIIKTVPVPVRAKPAPPRDPLRVLIDEHRYFDALRMVDTRLKKAPNNISLQMTRARILREQGNYQESIEQYHDILAKSQSKSMRASALNGLGWTYYRKALTDRQIGDQAASMASLQSANVALKQAAQLLPSLSYAWAGLGRVALAEGKIAEAEEPIKKAKRYNPNGLEIQLAEAELLLAKKQPEDALQILYGIKKTTTRDPNVYLLLAQASLDTGKVDDAIINLKQLLQILPDHTDALWLLSHSYELKMKPEDAEAALEKAIALNPMDEKSVNALLKIYDQRQEKERGLLLLRTLLKDRPSQAVYGSALLQRLSEKGDWEGVYQEGGKIIGPILSGSTESMDIKQDVLSLYCHAIYLKGSALLDRRELLKDPVVQQVATFSRQHLNESLEPPNPNVSASLDDRLNLLLLDPLSSVPPLPPQFVPSEADLPVALKISFLQGNLENHARLLTMAKKLDNPQPIAEQLYAIGDYEGALALVEAAMITAPQKASATQLKQTILQEQKALQEQLASLNMLPRKISDSYWQKAAIDALQLGSGDWKTHATIGRLLEKRKRYSLAVFHQRLAAKYAPTEKEENYWTRRAEKTSRKI